MAKKVRILLILLLGFFLIPSSAFACNSKPDKVCCKKETPKKSCAKDCCKKSKHSSKDKSGCNRDCSNTSCQCPTSDFVFILPFLVEIANEKIELLNDRHFFLDIKPYLSSGFYSIWTPPNIG